MARKPKLDITPVEPTELLTLSEGQAKIVQEAMNDLAAADKVLMASRERLGELLAMIRPEGANGFDPKTMTFYSVPQEEPKVLQMPRPIKILLSQSVTGTVDGPSIYVGQGPLALSVVTADDVVTTADGEFQHSPDGVTWFTLASITQITGVTTEFIAFETAHFSNIRFVIDAFVGTSVTIEATAEARSG